MSGSVTVHPHIRGEYLCVCRKPRKSCGSSPHPWGIRQQVWFSCRQDAVHPHIRGEYLQFESFYTPQYGSSPHPWGIRHCVPCRPCRVRFIPTSVGNTLFSRLLIWMVTVHPHIRGEYIQLDAHPLFARGSSPHPWGIRPRCGCPSARQRFIPTSVGNTREEKEVVQSIAVHPHIRGEYQTSKQSIRSQDGSSPHPWGIHR